MYAMRPRPRHRPAAIRQNGRVTPDDQLQWFRDNIEFFESINKRQLARPVLNCPPWTVGDLLTHLSFGLGVCYPIAASTPPDTPADEVFVDADRSCAALTGRKARSAFVANMHACADSLASMNPDASCWTYEGPGTVNFWIRRAAVETTVHRFDAELALDVDVGPLALDRAEDGIDETLTFAFELACTKIGAPSSTLHVRATDLADQRSFGSGETSCTLVGDAHSLLLALWGRHEHVEVKIEGDPKAANEWLTLVGRAFAGR